MRQVSLQAVKRLPWTALGWHKSTAWANWSGSLAPALRAPGLASLEQPTIRTSGNEALCADLATEDTAQADAWNQLASGEVQVVVTGQQPGVAGGTLLVLYKAATAVALARRLSARLRRTVLPLFWNASDDVDFDEIARVLWPTADGELLFFEMPVAERRAESFVGNLSASGDARAASAMLVASGATTAPELPLEARDHGHWVSLMLRRAFPDLVVLDARSAALRRHAVPLFAAYLRQREAARGAVEGTAASLESAGFTRVLSSASLESGLFLTPDGIRTKVANGSGPLEVVLQQRPEQVSPNVMLRALMQDALLPVVAQVVGPSECGYLLELRALRQLLGVPEPALVPRLTLTLVDAALWEVTQRLELAPESWLVSPQESLGALARRDLQELAGQLHAAFDSLAGALRELALSAKARERVVRRLAGLRQELEEDAAASRLRDLREREPVLARLPSWVRPRDQWQERAVAAWWLLSRTGVDTEKLVRLAEAHLERVAAGELEHGIVVI